jgi:hypothetical protein
MSDLTVKILQQLREDIAEQGVRLREDIARSSAHTDARFDALEARIDGVHARVDALDRTLGGHGARLEHIEGAIVAILNLIGKMNEQLDTHDVLLTERAR